MGRRLLTIFVVLFFLIPYSFAQTQIVEGFVKNTSNTPLEKAALIITSNDDKSIFNHTVSNEKGFFKISLKDNVSYIFTISYLGYKDFTKEIVLKGKNKKVNFVLTSEDFSLNEIVIDYKYKPIEKKKDTTTYNLQSFVNGNEYKMEDVVEKLPGLKTENGQIKFQGKRVTKLLVENKTFFNGSTKLALENIPADVMKKIEVIEDYNESALTKNLKGKKDIALNVVLKDDKKRFLFGEVTAGLGTNKTYIVHPTLFKYSPTTNISYIGDINNYNNSSISFEDLIKLQGGISNLIKNKNSYDLLMFVVNDKEKSTSLTKFSALNFYQELGNKITLKGTVAYNSNIFTAKKNSNTVYKNNYSEAKNEHKNNDGKFLVVNFNTIYKPKKSEEIRYSFGYSDKNFNHKNLITSVFDNQNLVLQTLHSTEEQKTSQNIDYYNKIAKKHTLGVAINLHNNKKHLNTTWRSSSPFLQKYYPLQQNSEYRLHNKTAQISNNLTLLIKDYWKMSSNYHLHLFTGISNKKEVTKTTEKQLLDNGFENVFSDNYSNFGNNLQTNFLDVNFGVGIKSKIKKAEVLLELTHHYFSTKISQEEVNNQNKTFIEPKLKITYNFNRDELLNFLYHYYNNFEKSSYYLKNSYIKSYNSIFQGNPNLLDEKKHHFNLNYLRHSGKYLVNFDVNYTLNKRKIGTSVYFQEINSVITPEILATPEQTINFDGEIEKRFKNSFINFSYTVDWLKNKEKINNQISSFRSLGHLFSLKWKKKIYKKTHFILGVKTNIIKTQSNTHFSFLKHTFFVDLDTKFFRNFILKTDFSYNYTVDYANNKTPNVLANIYLDYRTKNKKLRYGVVFENIFNNGTNISNLYSSFVTTSIKSSVIPRVFLAKLTYKF